MADDDTLDDRDERDERIGPLLEVEPLDELTRHRLVSTALGAAAPPAATRTRRWLVAAAVLLVVVGGGGALLATAGGGRNDQPTAAPALTPAQKNDGLAATPAAPGASSLPQTDTQSREAVPSPAPVFTGPPVDAGDFGDLSRRANVDRLRAAVAPSALTEFSAASGRGDRLSTTLATRPCAARLPEGTVVALATGHYGHRSAIVVVANLPSGERSIDVVITHPCEVRPL